MPDWRLEDDQLEASHRFLQPHQSRIDKVSEKERVREGTDETDRCMEDMGACRLLKRRKTTVFWYQWYSNVVRDAIF